MKNQFMPMFWGDFLANTLHLSAQEIGAYFLLIAHAWENGGRVPYGAARRIARVRNDHWPKVWKQLEPFFEWEKSPVTGTLSWGTHHRVRDELLKAAAISNKRKGAAEQMHENKRAKGMHLHHLPLTEKESLLCKEGKEAESAKPAVSTPGWRPRIDGDEERRPPRTKSDNPLEPIPERPPRRRAP